MKPAGLSVLKDRACLFSIAAGIAVSVMAVAGVLQDNLGEAHPSAVLRSLGVLTAIAVAAPLAACRIGGAFRFVGYAFPLMLFSFFKFVGFREVGLLLGLGENGALVAGVIALILVCAASPMPYRRRNPVFVSSLVLVIAAGGAIASVSVVVFESLRAKPDMHSVVAKLTSALDSQGASGERNLPDIIYIVPDRYGGEQTLSGVFGMDNSPFLGALEDRGFYVARRAHSNYAKTFQSLASTLNMTPLDELIDAAGPAFRDRKPIYEMIEDSAVEKTLRGAGYSFVHLGSWWQGTRRNRNAAVNFYGIDNAWSAFSEFERALLRTTPIAWFATYGGFVDRNECTRLKSQLEYLANVRKVSEKPVFAFAHLTLPHDPITMDGDGNCVSHIYYPGYGTPWTDYREAYADYVAYLDDQLLSIFDAALSSGEGRELVFVIQADEGPYPRRLHLYDKMNMFDFTGEEVRTKFGIINALYWNAEKYGAPFLTDTPVNNWRIILSRVLGRDIPLVEDERAVLFRDENHPYEVRDVTEVFSSPAVASRTSRAD